MCQSNLDLRQPAILKQLGIKESIPTVYFTQLMGLCMGYSSDELGFKKIMVDTSALIQKIKWGRAEAAAPAEG
jgi:heterodisulfide reductase subunit B